MANSASSTQSNPTRHAAIESMVRQRGFVTIENLASQFRVTVQTIRRDLAQLSEAGRVSRFHGSAGLPSSIKTNDYSPRKARNLNETNRIEKKSCARIPNRSPLLTHSIDLDTDIIASEVSLVIPTRLIVDQQLDR